jgi:hypothetical protein
MSTVIIEVCKMPCKKYLSGSETRKKKTLKQVCKSCRKLALRIKKNVVGGAVTQF